MKSCIRWLTKRFMDLTWVWDYIEGKESILRSVGELLKIGPQCEKDDKFTNEEIAKILKISVSQIRKHWIREGYDGDVFYQLYVEID